MNKNALKFLLFILTMLSFQYTFAHGGGGGGSNDFDSSNRAAERAAERAVDKQAAEKKQEQDDWADFMKAVNKPQKEQGHDHRDTASEK